MSSFSFVLQFCLLQTVWNWRFSANFNQCHFVLEQHNKDFEVERPVQTLLSTSLVVHGLLLLNLQRDRLAYRARRGEEVIAVAVPASADDGFNGTIELLVSMDMFGRIGAARVIEDLDSDELYGVVDVI